MDATRTEQLVGLLARHQGDLFRYVYSLTPHEADARDIVQETCIALCRKFDEYDATKPFLPWAFRFAQLEILKHRERGHRRGRLLSPDVVDLIAKERHEDEPTLHVRLQALDKCLAELNPADRRLIQQRYFSRLSVEDMVDRGDQSRRTLFRSLDRIRRRLFECVTRRVSQGEFE